MPNTPPTPTTSTSGASPTGTACIILPSPSVVALLQSTYASVIDVTAAMEATVHWYMAEGLLPSSRLCDKCQLSMRLDVKRRRWRCERARCRTERALFVGTFSARAKLPLRKAVRLLCHWSARTPETNAADMAGVDAKSASKFYYKLRDLCTADMLPHPLQSGSEGHVVEIDETSLKIKSTYNHGKRYPDVWLFGGVYQTTNK